MADEISEGARLRAHGVAITLGDEAHSLIFDYEALEFLEEEFQGLDAFMAHIREPKFKASRLRSVRLGITAGLLHEKPVSEPLEMFRRRVGKLVHIRDFVDYLDAITLAIFEAFPPSDPDEVPKATGSEGSPGIGSTTSRRSGSGARTKRSGA